MRAKLVNETIAFQRYRDPKEALGLNLRKNIIEREQNKLGRREYLITQESSPEEIEKFKKDCTNLKKFRLNIMGSRGVIPILLNGVKAGYIACIVAKEPEYGGGDLPYNDFTWYTIDEPDKSNGPHSITYQEDKIKEEIKKAKINKDI